MYTAYVAIALAIIVVILVFRTATVVPQQSAYVVENLGKYSRTLQAGFHILIPFVERVAYRHSLKEQALDVPEQVCITRDNVQVGVDAAAKADHRHDRKHREEHPLHPGRERHKQCGEPHENRGAADEHEIELRAHEAQLSPEQYRSRNDPAPPAHAAAPFLGSGRSTTAAMRSIQPGY